MECAASVRVAAKSHCSASKGATSYSEVKYIDRHIHRSYYLREVVRSVLAVLRSYGEQLFAFESIVAMCGEEGGLGRLCLPPARATGETLFTILCELAATDYYTPYTNIELSSNSLLPLLSLSLF